MVTETKARRHSSLGPVGAQRGPACFGSWRGEQKTSLGKELERWRPERLLRVIVAGGCVGSRGSEAVSGHARSRDRMRLPATLLVPALCFDYARRIARALWCSPRPRKRVRQGTCHFALHGAAGGRTRSMHHAVSPRGIGCSPAQGE